MTDDYLDIIDYYAALAAQHAGRCVFHGRKLDPSYDDIPEDLPEDDDEDDRDHPSLTPAQRNPNLK
jgi:hypothetical protein